MFGLRLKVLGYLFCLCVISFGLSNQAMSQTGPLNIELHIEQSEVFVFGVVTGWLEIHNSSDEQITIINGFFETATPWRFVVSQNEKEKEVGHWINADRVLMKMVIEPKGMVRKPICLYSDQNGLIFDEVGIGSVQVQTEATFQRSGKSFERQLLQSNKSQFSIVGDKVGQAAFKAHFTTHSLGFLAFFPSVIDEKYEEKFREYSVPYLQMKSYRLNATILKNYVQSKGTYWMGKKEGLDFIDVSQEMVDFCHKSGAGGWVWAEVNRLATKNIAKGSDGVFVSNSQIGSIFLAY